MVVRSDGLERDSVSSKIQHPGISAAINVSSSPTASVTARSVYQHSDSARERGLIYEPSVTS